MKKILIFLGIIGTTTVGAVSIDNALHPVQRITAAENNSYLIGVQNYESIVKDDITDDKPLQYKLNEKYISFKPISIGFDGRGVKEKKVQSSKKFQQLDRYSNIFGDGHSLEIQTSDRIWSKIVKIDSLESLGPIPRNAKNLEVVFEVDTNFVIDGWNKRDKFDISSSTIRLGDYSYIQPPMVWDSAQNKVCVQGFENDAENCGVENNRSQIQGHFKKENNRLLFVKEIPISFLENATFPVFTDVDVTYGIASTFETSFAHNISVDEIGNNKFVVCNTENNVNPQDLECRAATVSGTTITYGTINEIDSRVSGFGICVAKFEDDKFLTVYPDEDQNYDIAVCTVSGTTITCDITNNPLSANRINIVSTQYCTNVGTDLIAIALADDVDVNDSGFAWIASTTPGTGNRDLAVGSESQFETGEVRYPTICQVDTDQIMVMYEDQDDSDNLKAVSATFNSSDLSIGTWGTILTIATDSTRPDCTQIETDKVASIWYGISTFDYDAAVLTTSGTTITEGANVSVLNGTGASSRQHPRVEVIDTATSLFVYPDHTASNEGVSKKGTISGTNITLGSQEQWEAGATGGGTSDDGLDIQLISENKVVICFQDDDDSDRGKCIIGDVTAVAADPDAGPVILYIKDGELRVKDGELRVKQ